MAYEFNEGDQVWYVDSGDYYWGIPIVKRETITKVIMDGKFYGLGPPPLVKKAEDIFSDPKGAQAKVKEILKEKITRAENKLKELQEHLEEVSKNGKD